MRKQGSGGGALVEDEDKLMRVVQLTAGYSGSDLSAVCHEAAMGPIRELGPAALLKVKAEEVRAVGQGARWGRVRGRKLAFFHLVPILPVLSPTLRGSFTHHVCLCALPLKPQKGARAAAGGAALPPLSLTWLSLLPPGQVRALLEKDFAYAVQSIRPSVSPESLTAYSKWAEQYGVNR